MTSLKEMKKDLYELLGLQRGCSEDDIKKAYKRLALKHHPDKGGDPEQFKEISHAYAVLSDGDKRAIYDRYGHEGLEDSDAGGFHPGDIFSNFFGFPFREQQPKKKKRDKVHELLVSLEEVYQGKRRHISIERTCIDQSHVKKCKGCDGSGMRVTVRQLGPGMIQQQMNPCDACVGTGHDVDEKYIKVQREDIVVDIPQGCQQGHQIRLQGKANDFPGLETGDLIFVVRYKDHKTFSVQPPLDLVMTMNITLIDALCGFSRVIKHLDGSYIRLLSTSIIRPGDVKRISNEGLQRNQQKGSLFVRFEIEFPDRLVQNVEGALSVLGQKRSMERSADVTRDIRMTDEHTVKKEERRQHRGPPQQEPHQVHECAHQ